jgi:hypothetical protein
MIDIDARGRHEARRLREEAARIADTEKALRSVLDDDVVVPLQTGDPAWSRTDESDAVVSLRLSDAESPSRRWWPVLIAAAAVVLVVSALVLVNRDEASEPQVPVAPPAVPTAADGLIAFAGSTGESGNGTRLAFVGSTTIRHLRRPDRKMPTRSTWSRRTGPGCGR